MKTRTATILMISKVLAFMGAIGYAIICGSQLLTLVSSYINPEWAKRTYEVDLTLFSIRDHSQSYYSIAMILVIAVSALKAFIWYRIFDLLQALKLETPFSIEVEKKLEGIAYILFAIWLFGSLFWKIFIHYLAQNTGIALPGNNVEDEYLFIAGIMYIISQIFKRGIEMQEENQLTV